MKTDPTGAPQWVTYSIALDGWLSDICLTPDGGYTVVGSCGSLGAGGYDLYVAKLSSAGNLLWERAYGGRLNDFGADIEPTTDGGFILVGQYATGTSWEDMEEFIYLIKTTGSGAKTWSRTYRLETDTHTLGEAVCATDDGGYAALGYGYYWADASYQEIVTYCHLVKTDSQGNLD